MANLTYLDLVNKVLKRLREAQVTTVSYSTYSALIGEFVNEAKREVGLSWQWNALRHSCIFDADGISTSYDLSQGSDLVLVSGRNTSEYSILEYDERNMPMAFDQTPGEEMQLTEWVHVHMDRERFLNTDYGLIDKPAQFSLQMSQATTQSDGYTVSFYGIPAVDRRYRFHFYTPQEDMEEDDEVMFVPWQPVVNLAVLYALDERGEEIGEPGSKAWLRYDNSLSNAIAIDSRKDPHKITFTVP